MSGYRAWAHRMNDPGRDLVHPGPSQVARTRGRTTVSMSAATRTTRALHSQSGNATSARCRPARPHRWTLRITSTPDRTPRPSATPNPHRGRELRRTSGTQDWTTHPRDPRTGHVMTRTTGQSVTFSQYPPTPQLRPMGRHLLGPGMDAAPTTGTFPGSDRRTRLDTPPNQGPDPGRQTEPHSQATEPTNTTFPVSGQEWMLLRQLVHSRARTDEHGSTHHQTRARTRDGRPTRNHTRKLRSPPTTPSLCRALDSDNIAPTMFRRPQSPACLPQVIRSRRTSSCSQSLRQSKCTTFKKRRPLQQITIDNGHRFIEASSSSCNSFSRRPPRTDQLRPSRAQALQRNFSPSLPLVLSPFPHPLRQISNSLP